MTIGRPPRARDKIADIERLWKKGVHPDEIAEQLGISRPSVYRYAPISAEDRFLRSLRAEANRHIRRKRRELGMTEFRKQFPELLEDYVIDGGSDEEEIDEAMNLVDIDMTLWAERKAKLLDDAAEKTLRYESMKDPGLETFETDPTSKDDVIRDIKDQLQKVRKLSKQRDHSKFRF
jgi:AcrR family transcriptional regulator